MDKMMKTPRVARWKSEVMVVPQLITGPRSDSFRFVSLCWIVALFFVKQPALSASMDCIAYRHTDFDPTFNLMKRTLTGIRKEIPTWSLQPKFDGWTLYNLEFYTYYAQKASYAQSLRNCQNFGANLFAFTSGSITTLFKTLADSQPKSGTPWLEANRIIWLGVEVSSRLKVLVSTSTRALFPTHFDTIFDTGNRPYTTPSTLDATKCYTLTIGSTFPDNRTVTYQVAATACDEEYNYICVAPTKEDYAAFHNKKAALLPVVNDVTPRMNNFTLPTLVPHEIKICPTETPVVPMNAWMYPLSVIEQQLDAPIKDRPLLLDLTLLLMEDVNRMFDLLESWNDTLVSTENGLYCHCPTSTITSWFLSPMSTKPYTLYLVSLVGSTAGLIAFAGVSTFALFFFVRNCCRRYRATSTPAHMTATAPPAPRQRRVSFHEPENSDSGPLFQQSLAPQPKVMKKRRKSRKTEKYMDPPDEDMMNSRPFLTSMPAILLTPLTPAQTRRLARSPNDSSPKLARSVVPGELRPPTPTQFPPSYFP